MVIWTVNLQERHLGSTVCFPYDNEILCSWFPVKSQIYRTVHELLSSCETHGSSTSKNVNMQSRKYQSTKGFYANQKLIEIVFNLEMHQCNEEPTKPQTPSRMPGLEREKGARERRGKSR